MAIEDFTVREGFLALIYRGEERWASGCLKWEESLEGALPWRTSVRETIRACRKWRLRGEEWEFLVKLWRQKLHVGEVRGKYDPGGQFCLWCKNTETHAHWLWECEKAQSVWKWAVDWWNHRCPEATIPFESLAVQDIVLMSPRCSEQWDQPTVRVWRQLSVCVLRAMWSARWPSCECPATTFMEAKAEMYCAASCALRMWPGEGEAEAEAWRRMI